MLTKEDFENLINETRDKLDDKSKALVSEDMLGIMGNYNSLLTTLNDRDQELEKLRSENDELLKVPVFLTIHFSDLHILPQNKNFLIEH